MGISDKTRKVLWGRSASLCAFCKTRLVLDASEVDSESVVGDECHIVSGAPAGPRHDPAYDISAIDNLRNIVLLCRVHHKLVDDQAATFTADMLRQIKLNHEEWVRKKLNDTQEQKHEPLRIVRKQSQIPSHLVRVETAKSLLDYAMDCFGRYDDYPEDLNDEELETVGALLQNLTDWIDLGICEPSLRIDAQRSLAENIAAIDSAALRVYAAREVQEMRGGVSNDPRPITVLHLKVVRREDPGQIAIGIKDEVQPGGRTDS